MALKVVDRFTTRDGLWEVDLRPYGLDRSHLYQYGGQNIPGKGAASHIIVKATPHTEVNFFTEDSSSPQNAYQMTDANGWCNFPMWKSAAYWPPNQGPWSVRINGVVVATGLGLPEGLHVSTFLIVEDVEEGSQPEPTPIEGQYIQIVLRTMVDGLQTKEEILWQSR